jgi:hypothetical protein
MEKHMNTHLSKVNKMPVHIPFRNFTRWSIVGALISTTTLGLVAFHLSSGGIGLIADEPMRAFPNQQFNTSIINVIANSKEYHGKRVQISGYLRVRFEDIAIYLSKDDAQYGMTRNGFWVSFDETKIPFEKGTKGPIQYDGKYVLIEGTFDKNARGHKKLWSGTIKNVNRVIQLRRTE